jgi:lipoprotein-anchoring transpeptidase ErfK/SrfK
MRFSILLAGALAIVISLGGVNRAGAETYDDYQRVDDIDYSLYLIRTTTREVVSYKTSERPGTIIVDTSERLLYYVLEDGKAVRYGVGVGREGFSWSGVSHVSRKAEWPGWTPPAEMRARQPWLPAHVKGGPGNPLGARALYLGASLYRIHGTNEAQTIGRAVSSGCIRMLNKDVKDLYQRVRIGAKVIVKK